MATKRVKVLRLRTRATAVHVLLPRSRGCAEAAYVARVRAALERQRAREAMERCRRGCEWCDAEVDDAAVREEIARREAVARARKASREAREAAIYRAMVSAAKQRAAQHPPNQHPPKPSRKRETGAHVRAEIMRGAAEGWLSVAELRRRVRFLEMLKRSRSG